MVDTRTTLVAIPATTVGTTTSVGTTNSEGTQATSEGTQATSVVAMAEELFHVVVPTAEERFHVVDPMAEERIHAVVLMAVAAPLSTLVDSPMHVVGRLTFGAMFSLAPGELLSSLRSVVRNRKYHWTS